MQISDPKSQNDDVPDGDSSPVQQVEPEDQGKHRKRDYINLPSRPYLMKLLNKQGDQIVLFADKVLKFTCSGKMKCRILLITDFAVYLVDPENDSLKRRVALAAVEKLCLSELNDNFLAVIIPTEYDLLLASARKNEIITAFVEAYELDVVPSNSIANGNSKKFVKGYSWTRIKNASHYPLCEVLVLTKFQYNAASDLVKEIEFEEVEGGVKTRILRK